jgi:hypothetical protein
MLQILIWSPDNVEGVNPRLVARNFFLFNLITLDGGKATTGMRNELILELKTPTPTAV